MGVISFSCLKANKHQLMFEIVCICLKRICTHMFHFFNTQIYPIFKSLKFYIYLLNPWEVSWNMYKSDILISISKVTFPLIFYFLLCTTHTFNWQKDHLILIFLIALQSHLALMSLSNTYNYRMTFGWKKYILCLPHFVLPFCALCRFIMKCLLKSFANCK